MKEKLANEIYAKVREYFDLQEKEREPFKTRKVKIPLNVPTFGADEVNEALDSMLTTLVTMGKKVYSFEKIFADFVGVKYGTMVNSGSSANLIALSVLSNKATKNPILEGNEIITPAVTWATTISPMYNIGAVPYLVDVDMDTYNISIEEIQKHITKKTKAIMPVHLLGNPCKMKEIMEIAEEKGLYVIEDTCESHGATINGRKVGSFGDLSTFSFFFSHHITTIEGGMVLTNNEEYSDHSKALRAHGWIREMKGRDEIMEKYPEIDPRFMFISHGFNLRPTDLQGGFGIHQMKKIEKFLAIRRENARYWNKHLEEYNDYLLTTKEQKDTEHAWYGFPLTVKLNAGFSRKDLTSFLENKGIETRPLMMGNAADHPMIKTMNIKKGRLPNSEYIMRNSFFFGNHHYVGKEEREYVIEVIEEFISKAIKQ
jgi:CDP-6-deoxy-D-xylo-4-hexulose-3-dehydrase